MSCRVCALGLKGAVDYACVDCCARLLLDASTPELKAAYLRSMAKFGPEGYAERIRARYVEVKKQRKSKEEKK